MVFNPRNKLMKLVNRKNTMDDDASLGSTQSAGTTKVGRKRPTSKAPRKSVVFNEAINSHHENTTMTAEEIKELWYDRDDCRKMKDAYTLKVKTSCRLASSASIKDSLVEVLTRTYDACCDDSITEAHEQDLAKQLQTQAARAGLEHGVVKAATVQKVLRREKLLDLVYNLSRTSPSVSKDASAELLRKKCREVSRTARQYAYVVGRAHALSQQ